MDALWKECYQKCFRDTVSLDFWWNHEYIACLCENLFQAILKLEKKEYGSYHRQEICMQFREIVDRIWKVIPWVVCDGIGERIQFITERMKELGLEGLREVEENKEGMDDKRILFDDGLIRKEKTWIHCRIVPFSKMKESEIIRDTIIFDSHQKEVFPSGRYRMVMDEENVFIVDATDARYQLIIPSDFPKNVLKDDQWYNVELNQQEIRITRQDLDMHTIIGYTISPSSLPKTSLELRKLVHDIDKLSEYPEYAMDMGGGRLEIFLSELIVKENPYSHLHQFLAKSFLSWPQQISKDQKTFFLMKKNKQGYQGGSFGKFISNVSSKKQSIDYALQFITMMSKVAQAND